MSDIKVGTKVLIKNWNEIGVVSNLTPKGDMVDEKDFEVKLINGKTTIRSLNEVKILEDE